MAAQDKISTQKVTASENLLNNAEWVKRIERNFEILDSDKDGLVTINDAVVDKRKFAHLNLDSQVYERYRTAACNFVVSLGIYPGISLNKEEFVKNGAAHAQREIESVNKGEGSLLHRRNNRLLDFVSKNQDGISLEEVLSIYQNLNYPKSFIEDNFKELDTNNTGRVGIKEFNDNMFKLAYTWSGSEK